MNKILLMIFLLLTNISAIDLSKSLIMDISRTYGYIYSQNLRLDDIKKNYPNLKNEVFKAKTEFNIKFSDPAKTIEKTLSSSMTKKQWNDYQSKIKNSFIQNLDSYNYEDSQRFIQEVLNRSKGEIESPVIETLLLLKDNYQKRPIEELNDGFYQIYNTKYDSKAKGVDFSVRVPKSWKSSEGNRPNIIRKFGSNNGYIVEEKFAEYIMLMVFDLPIEINLLSNEDVNEICKDIPENSILRNCKKTQLENLPVIIQRMNMNITRLESSINMEVIQYMIYFKNKVIMIQGQVGGLNENVSEKVLLERFEKFKPVFNYVANSLVINDLYLK